MTTSLPFLDSSDPRLKLTVENRTKNVFVTQYEDRPKEENVNHIPVVTETPCHLLEAGLNTLQKTLVLQKRAELEEVSRQLFLKQQDFQSCAEGLAQTRSELELKQQQNKEREQNKIKQKDIERLTNKLIGLRTRQHVLKDRMIKYKIYEDYLVKTINFLPSSYLENDTESLVLPIIRRHETLSITHQELLQRLEKMEDEVEKKQQQLQTMKQEHDIKKLMANKELTELQKELDGVKDMNKEVEVSLLMEQGQSREKVEEVGSILMAINNLAESCYLPSYGPLENVNFLTMMDMVKEYFLDKADTERRARRLMESGSAVTSLADKKRRGSMKNMEGGWLVSEREDISSYFADQTTNTKIIDVSREFSTVRKVRGDGNCFYRAFSFAFLESAILNSRGLRRFIDMIMESSIALSCAGFDENIYKEHLSKVVAVLELCQSDRDVGTLHWMFNQPSTSDSVVQYLRLVTSAYLQTHEDFFSNFVEAPNLQAYCHQEVEVMAMECDHVDIQALSLALNVGIHIVSMEGDEQKLVHHIIPEGAEPSVHLLYQRSHYNIIYPRSQL
ncbi:hypothetical protein WMY93_017350 [Mugilogobius chulae]|uniref:ubiquitinyl hydrolase 1 n=1 Tax=Mugilogobius chulae TaxID=88201 RepID=A0AAW0NQN7_9GOBI